MLGLGIVLIVIVAVLFYVIHSPKKSIRVTNNNLMMRDGGTFLIWHFGEEEPSIIGRRDCVKIVRHPIENSATIKLGQLRTTYKFK